MNILELDNTLSKEELENFLLDRKIFTIQGIKIEYDLSELLLIWDSIKTTLPHYKNNGKSVEVKCVNQETGDKTRLTLLKSNVEGILEIDGKSFVYTPHRCYEIDINYELLTYLWKEENII